MKILIEIKLQNLFEYVRFKKGLRDYARGLAKRNGAKEFKFKDVTNENKNTTRKRKI